MFNLDAVRAKLTSYNSRGETHGKEPVPACDIRFEVKVPNTVLSHFGSQLRDSFYWAAPEHERPPQEGFDVVEPVVSDKPNLRNPNLIPPFDVSFEGAGYTLTVDYGLGGKSNTVLTPCGVHDVEYSPHEGGSVTLKFRVSYSDIDEKSAGRLSRMVKRECTITLAPPVESERLAA